jgi:hypothetical protein
MKYLYIFITLVSLLPALPGVAAAQTVKGQYIVFAEQEQSSPVIKTRVLVTKDFVRFDDGEGKDDYLVFDRGQKTLYNVRNDNHTIMLIRAKDRPLDPPFELKRTVKVVNSMNDAPEIHGEKPVHRQYLTNGKVCIDVISVKGLMPEAVTALKEFQEILASDSKMTFNNMPADLQKPCDIDMNTFNPTRHLSHGFPIQEWKPGYKRSLVDYKEHYDIDPKLFELPDGYFRFSVQQMREGRVDFDNQKIVND